jgi:hypothetical protein
VLRGGVLSYYINHMTPQSLLELMKDTWWRPYRIMEIEDHEIDDPTSSVSLYLGH